LRHWNKLFTFVQITDSSSSSRTAAATVSSLYRLLTVAAVELLHVLQELYLRTDSVYFKSEGCCARKIMVQGSRNTTCLLSVNSFVNKTTCFGLFRGHNQVKQVLAIGD
jgi:hypothetical protein